MSAGIGPPLGDHPDSALWSRRVLSNDRCYVRERQQVSGLLSLGHEDPAGPVGRDASGSDKALGFVPGLTVTVCYAPSATSSG